MPTALDCLLGLAQLYLQEGQQESALGLSDCILDHPSSSQETKDGADRVRVASESLFPAAQLELIRAQARTKTIEAIIAEALI